MGRAVIVVALMLAGTGCTSGAEQTSSGADYRDELAAVCVTTSAARATLLESAEPRDDPGFALSVAGMLSDEADAARALRAPEDLDADHRAFVQNTADQAALWTKLAATPPEDTSSFGELQTEILQLILGRDDLAGEIGVPECQVGPA